MIPTRGRLGVDVIWRQWTIGFVFGPGVWEFELGPLTFWFDPNPNATPDWVYIEVSEARR